MKNCYSCGPKPESEFYRDKSRADGLSNACKECVLEKRRRYRANNRDRLKLQARIDRKRFPERGCWHVMIARCQNPKHQYYGSYGGRGIRVCEEWVLSFESFLAHIGPRPSLGHSIDRIDVNGNYEPGNVRWATAREQARNTRSNRLLTAFGETKCIAEWAQTSGLKSKAITDRLDRLGWGPERAVSEPVHNARRAS